MTTLSIWKARNFRLSMRNQKQFLRCLFVICIFSLGAVCLPEIAFGSVESSLAAVQEKLVGTLLPLAAMCGLVFAGLSFVAGHPSARQHLFCAIVGCIIGFGAESIVALVRSLIH
jgi:type IV secretory pathway VirB2 component (pilin)